MKNISKNFKKPRYSRLSDIIDLVLFMQSQPQGIALKDIATRYNVSRRTAERLRDAILNVLPQVDELKTDTKEKRWGFTECSFVIFKVKSGS